MITASRAPSSTPQQPMSGDLGSTTSPTPSGSIATSSERSSSPPDCPARRLVAGPQRAAGLRGTRRRHRPARPRTRPPDPGGAPQGRHDRHHPPRTTDRPSTRPGHRRARARSSSGSTAIDSPVTLRPAWCAGSPKQRGSPSGSAPTACGTPSSRPPSMRACRSALCKRPRRTPTPGGVLRDLVVCRLIPWSTQMSGPAGSFVTRLITRELRMLWAWQPTGAG